MSQSLMQSSLSTRRQRLIRLMQQINFGRIENLLVQAGEPIFAPAPRLIREIKFAGDGGVRPEEKIEEFALKAQVVDMLGRLDELGDGRIETLEVKHGLPFRMIVEASSICGGAAH